MKKNLMVLCLLAVGLWLCLLGLAVTAEAQVPSGPNLTTPSTNRYEATITCAATATRLVCPADTKWIHTANTSATSVWWGGSNVSTTTSPIERSSVLTREYSANSSNLWCISAAGVASVRYQCSK